MSTNAGQLLWNRLRISLPTGTTDIDTGLTQTNKSFEASSVGEPPLGVTGAVAPAPGTLPASRIQVIPLPPTAEWGSITHSEPYVSSVTGTVHVTFSNPGKVTVEVNALFWDPHTSVGPGQADTYNAIDD